LWYKLSTSQNISTKLCVAKFLLGEVWFAPLAYTLSFSDLSVTRVNVE